jgi:hypothetical protein
MSSRKGICAFVVAACAAGCGGSGGVRPMRLTQSEDAATTYLCGTTNSLNCSKPKMLLPDGHVTNFSSAELTGTNTWCDASRFHGSTFSFKGNKPMTDTNANRIDPEDGSLKLSLTVSAGSYGGGGLAFESCLDATEFTGVQFSVAVSSGSLTGCTYQLQLQTFEQRPTSQNPPGACDMNTASCYNFPAATGLAAPSADPANPTLVTIPFSSFGASQSPAPAQLVGLQWQVNAAPAGCTVELRIDDIDFIPALPPSDAGTDGP